MTVQLYMDHQVNAAITEGLRKRGVDVITAFEDSAHQLDDEILLERVTHLGRVLFSQDADLLEIARFWLRIGHEFSGVIYGHKAHLSIGQGVRDLELIAKVYEPEEMYNRIEYLPL